MEIPRSLGTKDSDAAEHRIKQRMPQVDERGEFYMDAKDKRDNNVSTSSSPFMFNKCIAHYA